MEALFFGPSATHLYGVYHPADPHRSRTEGIVLCSPFGQEAVRAHRSLRQLADEFARIGYDVLRFDYRGTGDSVGGMDGVTPLDWAEDVSHAVRELQDISGAVRTSLLGLRLACLIAAHAATAQKVQRLVFWDPVGSGQDYLDELGNAIRQAAAYQKRSNFVAQDGTIHFNGFSMSANFQASLVEMGVPSPDRLLASKTLQVVSHETAAQARLKQHYASLTGFEYLHTPAPHDWNYVDHVGGIMFPQPIMQTIVKWFS
jgi:pimeloyl-ACP methyl ester carboxylesterase